MDGKESAFSPRNKDSSTSPRLREGGTSPRLREGGTSPRRWGLSPRRPTLVEDPKSKKRLCKFIQPELDACLPAFIDLLKLRGLAREQEGGRIILQIARRVFGTQLDDRPQYTLINTPMEFIIFLSKLEGVDVKPILEFLLDNLSGYETELMITYILKYEHINSADNFARGESVAGKLTKIMADRAGNKYFDDVILNTVQRLEKLIKRNPYLFAKYAYSCRAKQAGEMSAQDHRELTAILDAFLGSLCRGASQLPPLFLLACHLVDELDFLEYKIKVQMFNDQSEAHLSQLSSIEPHTYVVNYVGNEPTLYYKNTKQKLVRIELSAIENLAQIFKKKSPFDGDAAVNNLSSFTQALREKSVVEAEKALNFFHNLRLKRERKVGLLNTRCIGLIITTRCAERYDQKSDEGAILNSAINMLLTESLHVLGSNKATDDAYLSGFITEGNRRRINSFYDELTYRPTVPQSPRSFDGRLLVSEQQITYIILLRHVFDRFQFLCGEIKAHRGKKIGLNNTNEENMIEISYHHDMVAICIGDYCRLLGLVGDYMRKDRELEKVQGLYREMMEMCLLYILHVIIRPTSLEINDTHSHFVQYIESIAGTNVDLTEILTMIEYIDCSIDVPILRLKTAIEEEANRVGGQSYKELLLHIKKYLELFHPDFDLRDQTAILRKTLRQSEPASSYNL